MKKFVTFFFLAVFICCTLLSGCKKSKEYTLTGSYRRTQMFNSISYLVGLKLTDDGHLTWMPVDSIPGHTASAVRYSKTDDNHIRIYGDTDCGDEAVYSFYFDSGNLQLTAVTDDCTPRKAALNGLWIRQ